jgi:hypothetical protein
MLMSAFALGGLGACDALRSKTDKTKKSKSKSRKAAKGKRGKKGKSAKPSPAKPGSRLAKDAKVIFLHHSTGENIWNGGVAAWFDQYNKKSTTQYRVVELAYPHEPYPWDNYPYDYWNIWVKHAGPKPFKGQETLEMLTADHQVIVFKHCYPVSEVESAAGAADVASSQKTLANYQAQYAALKTKLRSFGSTRFLVWTGAALTKAASGDAEAAKRAKQFFDWVKGSWDERGDNIFVFDFHALETEGGLYMKDAHAQAASDPHPSQAFAKQVAPRFAQRIVDVIEGRGDSGSLTGG